jgi:hypothetical protein
MLRFTFNWKGVEPGTYKGTVLILVTDGSKSVVTVANTGKSIFLQPETKIFIIC